MGTLVLKGVTPTGIRAGYPIAILSAVRRLKFGFPYTIWNEKPRWMLPHDESVVKPQSIQYPPGMEPKENPCRWVWQDEITTIDCSEPPASWNVFQKTDVRTPREGDISFRV